MGKQSDHPRAYTKKAVQKGWLMYDWANSAYFLVIIQTVTNQYSKYHKLGCK